VGAMRLAISSAAAALGMHVAGAQAEPITLSVLQMDELTAGAAASTSVVVSTIAAPQGAVTATVSLSTSTSDPPEQIEACEIESTSPPSGAFAISINCNCASTTLDPG
jgi:hypothetical protein